MTFNCDSTGQVCTILIVDDSEADRLTYQRYLAKSDIVGCAVLESDCGETGLEICLQCQPDVVLLDYLLPDINGIEFLQTLRTQVKSPPPVIMLTGQGNEQVAVEAMKMGAQDYLVKGRLDADMLSQTIRRVLTQQVLRRMVARQQQQQQLMADIAMRISQSLNLDTILTTAVEGVRQLLNCDRTLIYRFASDMRGTVIAEAVLPEWSASLGTEIVDTCFQDNGAKRYLENHKTAIANIHESHLTPCHIQLLEQFQVRANIVVPILLSDVETIESRRLWGLLIAHHCRNVRDWQPHELELLDNLAVQLAIAIQQSVLVSMLQRRAEKLVSANQRLTDTANLLKTRNQELDEFAYIASHDIRAPLRAIANLANWLQDDLSDKLPPENQKQLELIQSRVKRLDGFIEALLQYSRAGRQRIESVPIDVHALVNDILDGLAPSEQLRISVSETMPMIETQKVSLQQVLSNLIGNAIKYHDRSDGHVSVTAVERGNMVEFAIADDGPGIAPEHHERIFGMFQTLVSRDTVDSTGIGLSIVKKIVENQGGEVTLQSALGQGSTFSFTWPKHSSE
ncbi:MAG: ATP-binding protein [Cyanobacteria bacterium P01_A01_bin.37]